MEEYYVYRLECQEEGEARYIKIGYTRAPEKRLRGILTGCPIQARICRLAPVGVHEFAAQTIETGLHQEFLSWRHHREWFRVTNEQRTAWEHKWKSIESKAWAGGRLLKWTLLNVEALVEHWQQVNVAQSRRAQQAREWARQEKLRHR